MLNIAVLVSGGGTNLQALLDSEARGENPNGKITLVVASKPGGPGDHIRAVDEHGRRPGERDRRSVRG